MENRKIILIVVIVVLAIIIIPQTHSRKRGLKNYEYFNDSHINGVIEDIYIRYKGVGFTMENGKEYVFYPYKNNLNNYKDFDIFASKGDKIFKERHSDTLILIKNGIKYKFTFAKFP